MKRLLLIACLVVPLPFAGAQPAAPAVFATEGNLTGKVVETMDASSYTYVLADTGTNKVWAASTRFAVKVGDTVTFAAGDPMQNYHSKTLNRDFALVYFTGSISVNGAASPEAALPPGHPPVAGMPAQAPPQVLPPGHPPLAGQTATPDLSLTGIKPAAGGKTIQQIFAAAPSLAGKPVTVRGRVVKYNAMILGKNWLHIRDGSGSPAKNDLDLAVTTTSPAKLGDIVLVTGILSTNKDFGYNYKFDVMMDGAQVVVEK
ncbi:MAG: nucleotide-binding protein [Verrucomicrobiae bacterium]|nr:nucleotide-binding protein [Verrucomicrobiae bacterium]